MMKSVGLKDGIFWFGKKPQIPLAKRRQNLIFPSCKRCLEVGVQSRCGDSAVWGYQGPGFLPHHTQNMTLVYVAQYGCQSSSQHNNVLNSRMEDGNTSFKNYSQAYPTTLPLLSLWPEVNHIPKPSCVSGRWCSVSKVEVKTGIREKPAVSTSDRKRRLARVLWKAVIGIVHL